MTLQVVRNFYRQWILECCRGVNDFALYGQVFCSFSFPRNFIPFPFPECSLGHFAREFCQLCQIMQLLPYMGIWHDIAACFLIPEISVLLNRILSYAASPYMALEVRNAIFLNIFSEQFISVLFFKLKGVKYKCVFGPTVVFVWVSFF